MWHPCNPVDVERANGQGLQLWCSGDGGQWVRSPRITGDRERVGQQQPSVPRGRGEIARKGMGKQGRNQAGAANQFEF